MPIFCLVEYETYGKQLQYFREFKKFENSFCGNYSRKYGKSTLKFVPLCKGKVGLQATCVIFIGNKIDVFFDAFFKCQCVNFTLCDNLPNYT